jgi:hypothetical protein
MSWKGAVIGSYVSDVVLSICAWTMLLRVQHDWRPTADAEVSVEPEISSAG